MDKFIEIIKKGKEVDPKIVAEKYGFGKEKRPTYIKQYVRDMFKKSKDREKSYIYKKMS